MRSEHLPKKLGLCGSGLVCLSCYGAGTSARRNDSPGAGRDGLRGDAHRFSHSRGIAARAAAPTHRLVYASETTGGTASYAGGYFFLRPPGGRRDPHYWTGARRNARADARSPGRTVDPI